MTRHSSDSSLSMGRLAATSFIGRRRELEEAKTLMSAAPLVTLTGPGGVGKTRLAGEITRQAHRAFRDGARVVELAPLRHGAAVAPVVTAALDIPDQSRRPALERLADYLQDKELLLVLDNCEHVLGEVGLLVDRILAQAPKVRLLATSREPIGLTAEAVFALPPLSVPPAQAGIEQLEAFESVALFLARARNVVPGFALDAESAPVIAQLCAQLDGMPLAIELATTRLRSLSATQLLARIDQRFALLTQGDRAALPRQQTLRALIDWSYELCSGTEQLLWRRLSVFPGSFDLEAAEEVCGFGEVPRGEVLDLLDALVAKSIVAVRRDGESLFYYQLVSIREYAQQLLAGEQDIAALRSRHLEHYLRLAQDMVRDWCGPGQARFLHAVRINRPNYAAAFDWALASPGGRGKAARLASLLRYQWVSGNFISEGRALLGRILDAVPQQPTADDASALWVAAWVNLIQGDHDSGARYARQCLQAAGTLRDPALAAHAEHWLALHRMFSGDLAGAIEQYQRVAAAHRKHGDTASQLTALFQLGMAQVLDGDPHRALATCQLVVSTAREHGELWNRAYAHWISALCYWKLGDYEPAAAAATQALQIQRDTFQDGICSALSLEALAWITVSQGKYERASELAHAVASVWSELGTSVDAFGPHMAQASAESHRTLARALGRRAPRTGMLSRAQALDCALGIAPAAGQSPRNPLTRKEREVAALVAEGLTNRAIAQRLVLSPRTIDGHVERILAKLGFSSRAQVAVWVSGLEPATG
ncbi:LuxR C-terminal-related transcriptional regulator [Glutamicibacter protophormiae]|uniref:ATP-binding protein n=1 Tax=Glutamicibacter protophormiae TaxID=37930 RepID=UPI002A81A6F2|nr:LuxR C-terminal-related transcriptional regulator [Glutamicibacter protophormiae]WPR64512.1 LuxR C-terminal-related transcriptional regulator [Glutamicibacter protophormiae]WPR68006.1 LuxR C-terminal-related transcriptional regulator [Glutamicibacter protophormiae]